MYSPTLADVFESAVPGFDGEAWFRLGIDDAGGELEPFAGRMRSDGSLVELVVDPTLISANGAFEPTPDKGLWMDYFDPATDEFGLVRINADDSTLLIPIGPDGLNAEIYSVDTRHDGSALVRWYDDNLGEWYLELVAPNGTRTVLYSNDTHSFSIYEVLDDGTALGRVNSTPPSVLAVLPNNSVTVTALPGTWDGMRMRFGSDAGNKVIDPDGGTWWELHEWVGYDTWGLMYRAPDGTLTDFAHPSGYEEIRPESIFVGPDDIVWAAFSAPPMIATLDNTAGFSVFPYQSDGMRLTDFESSSSGAWWFSVILIPGDDPCGPDGICVDSLNVGGIGAAAIDDAVARFDFSVPAAPPTTLPIPSEDPASTTTTLLVTDAGTGPPSAVGGSLSATGADTSGHMQIAMVCIGLGTLMLLASRVRGVLNR